MKTILAFETSCPILSVALGTQTEEILKARATRPLQHSENLIPLTDRLLRKAGLTPSQIDAFAIDRGPGSFTGLRIGFSLLKGFLAVKKKPCYGALSLDMIAQNIRLPAGSRLGVLADARREAIYSRFYGCEKEGWAAEGKLELLSFSELKSRIRSGTALVGDALLRYGEALKEVFGSRIHILNCRRGFPSATTLVQWFHAGDKKLSLLGPPEDLTPLYFRASEAEEKRRGIKKSCLLKPLPRKPARLPGAVSGLKSV